jgi:hypothetical protein
MRMCTKKLLPRLPVNALQMYDLRLDLIIHSSSSRSKSWKWFQVTSPIPQSCLELKKYWRCLETKYFEVILLTFFLKIKIIMVTCFLKGYIFFIFFLLNDELKLGFVMVRNPQDWRILDRFGEFVFTWMICGW